jgi:hypothetical protein
MHTFANKKKYVNVWMNPICSLQYFGTCTCNHMANLGKRKEVESDFILEITVGLVIIIFHAHFCY